MSGAPGIFEVQANEFRGFQYGDPIKHPKKITVTLYSADGRSSSRSPKEAGNHHRRFAGRYQPHHSNDALHQSGGYRIEISIFD
jgi:hypothetical protein